MTDEDRELLLLGELAADLIEVLLGCAAQGANPICGQVLKISALLDAIIGIALVGTVLVTAQLASIYAHSKPSFHMMITSFTSPLAGGL